jgi:hypothetical protein
MSFHNVDIDMPDIQTRRKHLRWLKLYVTVLDYSEQKFPVVENFSSLSKVYM